VGWICIRFSKILFSQQHKNCQNLSIISPTCNLDSPLGDLTFIWAPNVYLKFSSPGMRIPGPVYIWHLDKPQPLLKWTFKNPFTSVIILVLLQVCFSKGFLIRKKWTRETNAGGEILKFLKLKIWAKKFHNFSLSLSHKLLKYFPRW
jgi:hypothetical protein